MAAQGSEYQLKSRQFRMERQDAWSELEALVTHAEDFGIGALSIEQRFRLPALYRGVLSSLSVARAISLDANLLRYLEALAARAYIVMYGNRRGLPRAARDFVVRGFPERVRALWPEVAVAGGLLVLGTLVGFAMTTAEPERFYSFVQEALANGRDPTATCEELQSALYGTGDVETELAPFAAHLFQHNARIGVSAFAIGFAGGVPTALLVFTNGLMLGAFAAVYHRCALDVQLWGWLLPHGVTELLAVVLCGAAGLHIGRSLVLPGDLRRSDALASGGQRAAAVVLGAVGLFFVAGALEGFFRQLVLDDGVRWMVALTTAALWAAYFGFVGVRR
ncbi:MAG: stage II sporulation protein M [Myxococcota bacterium]